MHTYDLDNPFSITKATEFSDQQINEYWVDFNVDDKQSILSILNPREYLPKYILGGKGCGKTHILRYFSYPLQKIRANDDIKLILSTEEYIGIYSVLDGLNSSRFKGKGISEDIWASVFEYYFELYICDHLLNIIQDIYSKLKTIEHLDEETFVNQIMSLLLQNPSNKQLKNINELILFFSELRRKIDFEIVNSPFSRTLNIEQVKVLFSPGDLLFGIPNIFIRQSTILEKLKIIYILDEYEKLFEWQKVFINTIIWDKKIPCTFWIGARKYGYTTRSTKSGEEIKPGSEFQPVILDDIVRKNEEVYKSFAKKLYLNRLSNYFVKKNIVNTQEEIENKFINKFERYDAEKFISDLKSKYVNKEFKHIKELRRKLRNALKSKNKLGLERDDEIEIIIQDLLQNTENNPLEQKYKFFLFYQQWSKAKENETFSNMVNYVNEQYSLYKNKEKSDFGNIIEKFKKDFIAQLTSENNIKNTCYSGIEEFIDISWGNPRVFLLTLKIIIERSMFRGEKPLEDGATISLDSQFQGVYETAKWFYEDAEIIGDVGKNLYKSLNNLAELLRLYRFSDKPTETSVSCFNFMLDELSTNALNSIKLSELHSLFIEIDTGRKEKNSGRVEKLYQLNKVIAPYWNLPVVRRGTVSLDKELAEAILNPEFFTEFDRLYKTIKMKLNAPFFNRPRKNINEENSTLFGD